MAIPVLPHRVSRIIHEVCRERRVSVDALYSPSKLRPFCHARHHAAARLREEIPTRVASFPQIAKWLGWKDHTSAIFAVRAHAKRITKAEAESEVLAA